MEISVHYSRKCMKGDPAVVLLHTKWKSHDNRGANNLSYKLHDKAGSVAVLTVLMFTVTLIEANSLGFKSCLIHRDSPESPLYDENLTDHDRFQQAIGHDLERRFYGSLEGAIHHVGLVRSEYFMKLAIGTPPFEILANMDSGSNTFWIQCDNCEQCYPLNRPMFDPEESSTYHEVQCGSAFCHEMVPLSWECDDFIGDGTSFNACQYNLTYGDNSNTLGVLATESITLYSPSNGHLVIPNITFGCGRKNVGLIADEVGGLIGLGLGPASLVNQMGSIMDRVFSYCLSPWDRYTNSSRIHFGAHGYVTGTDAITVRMVREDKINLVNVEALTVGTERFKIDKRRETGRTCIDSGTTLMYFGAYIYNNIRSSLIKQMATQRRCSNYEGLICYVRGQEFLEMVIHFEGGVDLKLHSYNVFLPRTSECICFAMMAGREEDPNLIGNIAQRNFLVGYDIDRVTVSFKPTLC